MRFRHFSSMDQEVQPRREKRKLLNLLKDLQHIKYTNLSELYRNYLKVVAVGDPNSISLYNPVRVDFAYMYNSLISEIAEFPELSLYDDSIDEKFRAITEDPCWENNINNSLLKRSCLKAMEKIKFVGVGESLELARKSDEVLLLIFNIGKNKIRFHKRERAKIGDLLAKTLPTVFSLDTFPFHRHCGRLESAVQKKRSALQYLVEDYAKFPVGGRTLSIYLKRCGIKKGIKILDRIIKLYKGNYDSDICSEPESDIEEYVRCMPKAHTWWH